MRARDDRYRRELRRNQLALRLIRHQVRSETIRLWTGLSQHRVRWLCRHYHDGSACAEVARHRGPPPTDVVRIMHNNRARAEAAVAAGICVLDQVVAVRPRGHSARTFPNVARGERLCNAYEHFRCVIPDAEISLEQSIRIASALAQGFELSLVRCVSCGGVLLRDCLGTPKERCPGCCVELRAEKKPNPGELLDKIDSPAIEAPDDLSASPQGGLFTQDADSPEAGE